MRKAVQVMLLQQRLEEDLQDLAEYRRETLPGNTWYMRRPVLP